MKGLVEERELLGEDGNEEGEGEGIGDILVVGIVEGGDVEMGGGGNVCAARSDDDMDGVGVRDGDKMPMGMEGGCKGALDDEECMEDGQGGVERDEQGENSLIGEGGIEGLGDGEIQEQASADAPVLREVAGEVRLGIGLSEVSSSVKRLAWHRFGL